ncbi:MAG: DegT/DnrJ/EryC1/StrS family aminotransferase [Candidatus Acetothermia bacterium]
MKLAVNGGDKVRNTDFSPWPIYDEKERDALLEVLNSKKWFAGYLGGDKHSKVAEFEQRFANYQGAKHGIAVTNGGAALIIALRALGIGIGDEVIVPSYTYIATASAVLHNNALPVIVDIEPEHLCIDPNRVVANITENTRAIIPVHYGGQIANMDEIMNIVEDYDLYLVEDAAHAHGTTWKGKKAGQFGDVACFSFQESKNITAGEGGMLLTDDDKIAERARSFRSDGRKKGRPGYEHHRLGWNFRMLEFQASLLNVQLDRFKNQIKMKTDRSNYLSKQLRDMDCFEPITDPPGTSLNGHYTYDIRYDRSCCPNVDIDDIIEAIQAEGVPCDQMYLPIDRSPLFSNSGAWPQSGMRFYTEYYPDDFQFRISDMPVATRVLNEVITFPHRILLGTNEDVNDVVGALRKVSTNIDELAG